MPHPTPPDPADPAPAAAPPGRPRARLGLTRASPARSGLARVGLALAVLAGGGLLYGWTHGPHPDPASTTSSLADAGTEVGNARPVVLRYDRQLVRRCQALALYPTDNTDDATLRAALHTAATRAGLTLTDLPPGVLSPATLELQVPTVVACLPPGATGTDAARVLATPLTGEDHHRTEPVLIHDLAFTATPADHTPQQLADALDREGILADALGHYDTDLTTPGRLVLRYTGPLLSDDEIDQVRTAIAHTARTGLDQVTLGPQSPHNPGIDLRTEPQPAEVPTPSGSAAAHVHQH